MRSAKLASLTVAGFATLMLGNTACADSRVASDAASNPLPALLEKAAEQGRLNVIVTLRLPGGFTPEGELADPEAVEKQRRLIAATKEQLLDSLRGYAAEAYASWNSLPNLGLRVDAAALEQLANSRHVRAIQEDARSGTH